MSIPQTNQQIKPGDVWPIITARINSGSPFSTGAAAWNGSEKIATRDGDISLSIAFTSGATKTVCLRATTKDGFLGSIPIAERIGRGQYESLAGQADVDHFLNQVAPQEKECLLDLALTEFAKRSQWDGVATITIWQNYDKAAWLSRDSDGYICLQLFRDAAKLANRKYSNRLAIGSWSPNDAMWVESHSVREDYQAWSVEARRMVA